MHSALTQISVVAIGYAVLVALLALGIAASRRPRPAWVESVAWMLELLMLIRAVAGVGSILAGHEPDELFPTIGYLVASVAILPIALSSVDEEDRGPWSSGVIAVAAIALAVIGVRLEMTT